MRSLTCLVICVFCLAGCTKQTDRGLSTETSTAIDLKQLGDLLLLDLIEGGDGLLSSNRFVTILSNRVERTLTESNWRNKSVVGLCLNLDTNLWMQACRTTNVTSNWLALASFRAERGTLQHWVLKPNRTVSRPEADAKIVREAAEGGMVFVLTRK